MKRWKLPSWVEPKKAVRALQQATAGGLGYAVRERARELALQPLEPVTLPGFHLFTRGGAHAPYTWLLPQLKCERAELVQYWEVYVGEVCAHRGARLDPLRSIVEDRTVLKPQQFKRHFGGPRNPGDWATPAARIIALAQSFEGQESVVVKLSPEASRFERTRFESIAMHLGNFYMEVTSTTLYSNFGNKTIRPGYRAGDATLEDLSIRPVVTKHPLAHALLENEEATPDALYALSVALKAREQGLLTDQDLRFALGTGKRPAREELVRQALHALESTTQLRAVYDTIVPALMSAVEFTETFGSPFRAVQARRPSTVNKWRNALYDLAQQ